MYIAANLNLTPSCDLTPILCPQAPSWYLPVSNYFVVPRLGNPDDIYDGLHMPICARHNVIPPTREMPVMCAPLRMVRTLHATW